MDTTTLRLLFVVTDLIAPLVVGYLFKKRHLITQRTNDRLIKFNIIIVNTILSLLSFWVLPLSWSLLLLPLFGFYLVLFPGGVGYLLFARRLADYLDRGAYVASAMLANLGTLGGVCAFILYNEQGFAYTQLIGAFQNMLLCLVVFPYAHFCQMKAAGREVQHHSRLHDLREMFLTPNQMCLVGMIVGLTLNACGIERPAAFGPVFQSLVHIGAWSAMLPVGFLLSFGAAKRNLGRIKSLTFLRFVLMPIVTYLIAKPIVADPILRHTIIILSCCPTAINAVLSTRLYKLNVDLAATSFLVTTAAYLVVIFPILFFLMK
ncbi:AEC family transporter [uncultured Selenomonas sp.]|uniref:AEC family transporter n=1 Tax=uncultured Selenomonas sp. TaxID=159275 RepID=UPI0025CC053A|nr:AEC family transporter [uncultured Selenomonas sp.]